MLLCQCCLLPIIEERYVEIRGHRKREETKTKKKLKDGIFSSFLWSDGVRMNFVSFSWSLKKYTKKGYYKFAIYTTSSRVSEVFCLYFFLFYCLLIRCMNIISVSSIFLASSVEMVNYNEKKLRSFGRAMHLPATPPFLLSELMVRGCLIDLIWFIFRQY